MSIFNMHDYAFTWRRFFAVLPAIAVLMTLGVWQLHRASWKHDLLEQIEQRQVSAPVLTVDVEKPEDLRFRHAQLTGMLERNVIFDLQNQSYNGKPGSHWVVPMIVPTVPSVANPTNDPAAMQGVVVLVDLGWVPPDYTPTDVPDMANIETISGTLREPAPKNAFALPNPQTFDQKGRKLYWLDMEMIAQTLNAPVYPLVLYADGIGNETPPIGGQLLLTYPNDHLMYAFTWFALALGAAIMFVAASRKAVIQRGLDPDQPIPPQLNP